MQPIWFRGSAKSAPSYTASIVSKSEFSVVTVTVDVDAAVKSYQTVLPISVVEQINGSPGWPASVLAKTVLSV